MAAKVLSLESYKAERQASKRLLIKNESTIDLLHSIIVAQEQRAAQAQGSAA